MIRELSAGDRDAWTPLWRGYQGFYRVDIPGDVSALTWARLLDPAEPVGAPWPGRTAAPSASHHVRHRSTWTAGDDLSLQDLFVAPGGRSRGTGRALIAHAEVVARAAGCSRLHWLTRESDADAMRLSGRVAERSGFVQYRKVL